MTGPALGSAAEEAAKLLAAAEHWARTRGAELLGDDHLSTGAPACTVCPVCQAVTALRQVRPETVSHLLDAAGSVVAALRAAASTPSPTAARDVQHIDLDET